MRITKNNLLMRFFFRRLFSYSDAKSVMRSMCIHRILRLTILDTTTPRMFLVTSSNVSYSFVGRSFLKRKYTEYYNKLEKYKHNGVDYDVLHE